MIPPVVIDAAQERHCQEQSGSRFVPLPRHPAPYALQLPAKCRKDMVMADASFDIPWAEIDMLP